MRWLFLGLLIGLFGCAPKVSDRWAEIPPAENLLAQLAAQSGRYSTLDAAAAVHLTAKGKYFPSRQFLLLERPDHLRTDVLTGFGQLVLQLTSDGEELAVFLNHTVPGRFLHGPASYDNISRFVRIPLATKDLLAILLYDPPVVAFNESRVELSSDRLMLVLAGGLSRQELVFNEQLRLIGCRYFQQDKLQLSVEYSKISEEDLFPRRLIVEIPAEETRVKLTYSELELNGRIDSQRFRLKQPDGSIVEALP